MRDYWDIWRREAGTSVRYPINLSSEPFRRDRAVTIFASVAAGLLAVTLGLLVLMIVNERQAKSDLVAAIAQASLLAITLNPGGSSVTLSPWLIHTSSKPCCSSFTRSWMPCRSRE